MRAHSNEHGDSLPVLDVSSLKHVAYVLDALVYYMRADTAAGNCQSINAPLLLADPLDPEPWVIEQQVSFTALYLCVYYIYILSCFILKYKIFFETLKINNYML